MYKDMKEWVDIRLRVLRGESSKRQTLGEKRMHWTTLEKILRYSEPPGYRLTNERSKPKIGLFLIGLGTFWKVINSYRKSNDTRPSGYTNESKRRDNRVNTHK